MSLRPILLVLAGFSLAACSAASATPAGPATAPTAASPGASAGSTAPSGTEPGVGSSPSTPVPFPSFSAAPETGGLIVFVRRTPPSSHELATIRPDGSGLKPIPNSSDATDPALAPDGKTIAYSRAGAEAGIWTAAVDGSNRRRVATVPKVNLQEPAWSPDGKRLAFVGINTSGAVGPSDLYLVDADGSHLTKLSEASAGDRPSWSPDGSRIAFEGAAGGGIWTIGIGGGGVAPLLSGLGSFASWAPDGHRLLFERQDESDPTNVVDHIFVVFADGSSEQQVTSGPTNDQYATWSPDGRAILFAQFVPSSKGGAIADLVILGADGSLTNLTNTNDASEYLPSWR